MTDDATLAEHRARVAASPDDVIALHNLGVELRKRDRLDEAYEVIERALRLGARAPETATLYAHLLADFGRFDEAVTGYRRVLAGHPGHIDAHETLARLLPQIGRRAEAFDSYRVALVAAPHIGMIWMSALGTAKELRDAGQLLLWITAAKARFGSDTFLTLLAAQARSWRGEIDVAIPMVNEVLAEEPENVAALATYAQLLVRSGEYRSAGDVALTAARIAPHDQGVWALLTIIWRLTGDVREDWLAGYDRLILEMTLDDIDLAATAEVLTGMHRTRDHPGEQSLRDGTQTRGLLFDKTLPEVVALKASVARALHRALEKLPDEPVHPFLSRNTGSASFAGSWSVRLRSAGHHISHIHHAGWLSSACYIALPGVVHGSKTEGALTFGVPEPLLGVDLTPRRTIAPTPGKLVLFPSYLWHGTTPFHSTQPRLTVAFDALPVDKSDDSA